VVYRACIPGTDDLVALKVIRFDTRNDKVNRRLKKLFITEAALAKRVKHPNIVEIHDAAIEENYAWIAMELVEGKPLREYCAFDKLLPPHLVVDIIFRCAMALDYAARRGIVHRDIKPDNIVYTESRDVKIMDFGLALNLRKDHADSTFIMGVGSPAYMSPEQIKDYPLNGQTDLYSLGVVMYEMLTGRLAFRAQNRAALMYKIINMDAEPVSLLNPSVPPALDPIVRRILEKDLYSRYRSGMELAQDLSGAKFQILDDADSDRLTLRYKKIRQCRAFTEFANDELWEVLRISHWRTYPAGRQFMTEGEPGGNFGVILEGEVEVSLKGKLLGNVRAGELIGELAFLLPEEGERTTTMVATTEVTYLEVSAPAFELASDECRTHFHTLVAETLLARTKFNNERLITMAPDAMRGEAEHEFSFDLIPIDGEAPTTGSNETSILLTSDGGVYMAEDEAPQTSPYRIAKESTPGSSRRFPRT